MKASEESKNGSFQALRWTTGWIFDKDNNATVGGYRAERTESVFASFVVFTASFSVICEMSHVTAP